MSLETLIKQIAAEITKEYKADSDSVEKELAQRINKNKDVNELFLQHEANLKEIQKRSVYRNFIKKFKKDLYFGLRTYQKENETELYNTHVSTKERQKDLGTFIQNIDEYLRTITSLIDIGGGMFPTTFPFSKYPNITDYTWIDKDKKSYDKLLDFKGKHNLQVLNLHCQSIGELSWGSFREDGYDLALMLKTVPVIFRQEKLLLNLLANVPANTYIITGSKEAMVKKKNIEDRENSVIQRFMGLTGKEVKRKFEIENEFGYVIS